MAERRIGIIVNGATGRMGYRQHLVRSLLAIQEQGGVELADGDRLVPDLLLVGRNEEKLRGVAEKHGLLNWTTDVDEALANDDYEVYFDALVTNLRVENLKKAIAAGKAIYTEKPTAETFEDALELANLAKEARHRQRRRPRQALPPGAAQAAPPHSRAVSSARSSRCAASSATGSTRVTGRPPSAPPGTIAPRMAAASSRTCSRTGTT